MAIQHGKATVMLYLDGTATAQLLHSEDGGEAYMVPLLRSAIRYAKTHYGDGSMIDILMSENCFVKCGLPDNIEYNDSEHKYFLTARYDIEKVGKVYHAYALHGKTRGSVPMRIEDIPDSATKLV